MKFKKFDKALYDNLVNLGLPKTKIATMLGMSRSTLYRKLEKMEEKK